ncbi:MAG: hypothetical protein KatS3mg087_1812 [Patescibacteria group bacterium]|nr:MAG: hypothetical protein KatS3mg087_1812 [Patescibacteria group bacterium]
MAWERIFQTGYESGTHNDVTLYFGGNSSAQDPLTSTPLITGSYKGRVCGHIINDVLAPYVSGRIGFFIIPEHIALIQTQRIFSLYGYTGPGTKAAIITIRCVSDYDKWEISMYNPFVDSESIIGEGTLYTNLFGAENRISHVGLVYCAQPANRFMSLYVNGERVVRTEHSWLDIASLYYAFGLFWEGLFDGNNPYDGIDDVYWDMSTIYEGDEPPPSFRFRRINLSGGGTQQWQYRGEPDHSTNINQTPENDDEYIYSESNGQIDIFTVADTTSILQHESIEAVIPYLVCRKGRIQDPSRIDVKVTYNSVDNVTQITPPVVFGPKSFRLETAPDGSQWTKNILNSSVVEISSWIA